MSPGEKKGPSPDGPVTHNQSQFTSKPTDWQESPEVQFRAAMRAAGIEPPDSFPTDGTLFRFATSNRGNDDAGWLVAYLDGLPTITFGDWRKGIEETFSANTGRAWTPSELADSARRVTEAKAVRDAEKKAVQEAAAGATLSVWEGAFPAPEGHPYLTKKGIKPHVARILEDGRLVVPLFNSAGVLTTLEYIDADGGKLFHRGGKKAGSFCLLGEPTGRLFVAEGYATGATVHEVTGAAVAVALDAGNLEPVAIALRAKFPNLEIIIAGDNDASGVGQAKAEAAAKACGGRVVVPSAPGDWNDIQAAGGDLSGLTASGHEKGAFPFVRASELEPGETDWLVEDLIPAASEGGIIGATGTYKSFLVIALACSIATGRVFFTYMVPKARPVAYLVGEGMGGIPRRVRAWELHSRTSLAQAPLFFSKHPADLLDNVVTLAMTNALDRIAEEHGPIGLIVLDTLTRSYGSGDENSTADAAATIKAIGALKSKYGATVLYVHHTGHLEPSRGRGSSAFRAALDFEFLLVKKDGSLIVSPSKVKDGREPEPLAFRIHDIDLGFTDRRGRPVTSAVLVSDAMPEDTGPRLSDTQRAVLAIFQKTPGTVLDALEVSKAARIMPDTARKVSASLVDLDLVEKVGRGKFQLAASSGMNGMNRHEPA